MHREVVFRRARATALLTALLVGCCPGTSFAAYADGQDAVDRLTPIAMDSDPTSDDVAQPQAWLVFREVPARASTPSWLRPRSPFYGGVMPLPGDRSLAIRVQEVSGAARLRVVLIERSAIDQVLEASPAAGSIGNSIDASILSDVGR